MNKELNELIAHYEEERTKIEELLAECLQFSDYKYARQFQSSLGIVNNQLIILKFLRDPSYLKKKGFEDRLEDYQKVLLTHPQISDFINERIKREERNLDALNNVKIQPFFDGQEFDDAIFDLVDGKIQSFTFHLKRTANLYLKFECKKKNLVVSLTPDEQIGSEIYFPKIKKRALKSIGFKKNGTKEYFRLKFPLLPFNDSQKIKTIISRVIYDVFFINKLDSETILVIHS